MVQLTTHFAQVWSPFLSAVFVHRHCKTAHYHRHCNSATCPPMFLSYRTVMSLSITATANAKLTAIKSYSLFLTVTTLSKWAKKFDWTGKWKREIQCRELPSLLLLWGQSVMQWVSVYLSSNIIWHPLAMAHSVSQFRKEPILLSPATVVLLRLPIGERQ